MASEKIVNKIIESAERECQEIIDSAEKRAKSDREQIEKETEETLENMNITLKDDMDKTAERLKLNTQIDERKDLLRVKREVLAESFGLARKKLENLPIEQWRPFVYRIIMDAVNTDTTLLKVPKKDMPRYTEVVDGKKTFLETINDGLAERGHKIPLILDENPAHFSDGVMLIGKYSDVNASFDVLVENLKEYLEWDVTEILFKEDNK